MVWLGVPGHSPTRTPASRATCESKWVFLTSSEAQNVAILEHFLNHIPIGIVILVLKKCPLEALSGAFPIGIGILVLPKEENRKI